MKTWRHIDKEVLKSLRPCEGGWRNYLKHYSDFSGDIAEFLELEKIAPEDRIWVFVRVAPRLLCEVFAVDCSFGAAAADAYAAATYAANAYADATYADAAAAYAAYAAAAAAYAAAAAAAADAYADATYADAAAAYAAAAAAYAAAAAAAAARKQARENQIDVILMIIEGE